MESHPCKERKDGAPGSHSCVMKKKPNQGWATRREKQIETDYLRVTEHLARITLNRVTRHGALTV